MEQVQPSFPEIHSQVLKEQEHIKRYIPATSNQNF
jgi:hypothetical protein